MSKGKDEEIETLKAQILILFCAIKTISEIGNKEVKGIYDLAIDAYSGAREIGNKNKSLETGEGFSRKPLFEGIGRPIDTAGK